MFFEVFEGSLPLSFEVLFADAGDDAGAGAVATVGGAAICDEEEDTIRVAVDEAGDGHVRVLAAGICEFFGGCPAFLDAWDDLATDGAVRVVFINKVEEMRCDGHGQLVAGEEDTCAFLVAEVDIFFKVGKGVDPVTKLPFVIGPGFHGGVRPVAGCMRMEGGIGI